MIKIHLGKASSFIYFSPNSLYHSILSLSESWKPLQAEPRWGDSNKDMGGELPQACMLKLASDLMSEREYKVR